jgi:predicted dienelactone hydrolase
MRAPSCRVLAVAGLVVALLVLPSLAPRAEAAPDPGQKGPYAVGFTSFVLTDPSRPGDGDVFAHRPIPVYVWYPVDPGSITASTPEAVYPLDPLYKTWMLSTSSDWEKYGIDGAYQEAPPSAHAPFPLVIFSPGWQGEAWAHISDATRLASHGFVVAVLYHFGDGWWPWEPFDHIALAAWNRPRDMSFALTDLLAKNSNAGSPFHGLMQPDQVVASGWSIGGYASMALAGGDDIVCDHFTDDWVGMGPPPPETCTPTYPDPRFKAIASHDGSAWALTFQELARVTVPAMSINEEWNTMAPWGVPWSTQIIRAHAAWSSRPKYRVDVFNSTHQSFSDWCEGARVLDDLGYWIEDWYGPVSLWQEAMCTPYTPTMETHRLVGEYMVSFLKTQVAGEIGYQSILTPGWALTHESLIEFFETEKRDAHAIDDELGWEDWPGYFIYFLHQPGSEQARGPKDAVGKVPPPLLNRIGGHR